MLTARTTWGQPPAPSAPAPRRLRALLMDDEPMVPRVGVKQFGRMGVDVETAATCEEAAEKFGRARAEGRPIGFAGVPPGPTSRRTWNGCWGGGSGQEVAGLHFASWREASRAICNPWAPGRAQPA